MRLDVQESQTIKWKLRKEEREKGKKKKIIKENRKEKKWKYNKNEHVSNMQFVFQR